MMGGRSANRTSKCAPLKKNVGTQEYIPSSNCAALKRDDERQEYIPHMQLCCFEER